MSYYIIKSRLTNFVLDCEGGGNKPGARVIPYDKNGHDNQIWYDDPSTGTIRSKGSQLCMDIEGGQLVVKPFQQGDPNQQWHRQGNHIRNRIDNNKVLDIADCKKEKGAKVTSWAFNGGPNQSWDFENVAGQPPVSGGAYPQTGASTYGGQRKFYIVSELNGKVVDIVKANPAADVKIIMYDKHLPPANNQLWYQDGQGFIVSALNGMTFSNSEKGHDLKMHPASGNPRSQWTLTGNKIQNRAGEYMDIKGASNSNGADLISYSLNDKANQHFRFEYV